MRQSSEALANILTDIRSAIKNGRYSAAAMNATDLINMAYHLQSKEDLFLGEVLEAIYLQIHQTITSYRIPDDHKAAIDKAMESGLDDLIRAHTTKGDINGMLVDMRYNATTFQHTAANKYDQRPLELQR